MRQTEMAVATIYELGCLKTVTQNSLIYFSGYGTVCEMRQSWWCNVLQMLHVLLSSSSITREAEKSKQSNLPSFNIPNNGIYKPEAARC